MENFINIVDSEQGKQVQFIDGRYYTKDYKSWYPGVTSILGTLSKGKQYETWLKSNGFNADILAKKAMEQGSRVHEAIENLLKGEIVSYGSNYSREEWVMISRFVDFYTEFKPVTVDIEKVLVSDTLMFGTQLDYVARIKGELYYIDHKTGSLYDSANLQVSASVQLWNEYFPEDPISKGAVLHLDSSHRGRDKAGKKMQGEGWQLVIVDDMGRNWSDFQSIHQIWKRNNPDYKPFNQTYPAVYALKDNQ